MAASPRVLIAGYYGFGNTGDEAILGVMLNELRALRPGLSFTVLSGHPANTACSHDVAAIDGRDIAGIRRAVADADVVLVGGGGLFQDYWGVDVDSYFTANHHCISYYALIIVLAHWLGKPCMLYAVGVGPLLTSAGRDHTCGAARLCDVISVRDEASAHLLESLCREQLGGRPEVQRCADPAFLLVPQESDHRLAHELLGRIGLPAGTPFLGVCLRHWQQPGLFAPWEPQVAQALRRLAEQTSAALVFIPFQTNPGCTTSDDVSYAQRFVAQAGFRQRVYVVDGVPAPAVVAALLAQARAVLAMRYHAVLFALTGNVSLISIAYDPKVAALMQQANLADQCIALADVDAEDLTKRLICTWRNTEVRNQDRALLLEQMRTAASQNALLALSLLAQRPRQTPISVWENSLALTLVDQVVQTRADLCTCREMNQTLTRALQDLHHSRSWRFATSLQKMRRRLAPSGSPHARLARFALRLFRKLVPFNNVSS